MTIRLKKNSRFPPRPSPFALWIAACCSIIAALSLFSINWNSIAIRNTSEHLVKEIGFSGYLVHEAYDSITDWFAERMLSQLDAGEYNVFISKVHKSNLNSKQNNTYPYPQTKRHKHLIYVQMESVDGIAIEASVQGEPIMPFLHQLSLTATNLPNTLDNTSSGRTTDGEFLVLTSLPPIAGKPIYPNYDLSKIPSMPRSLNEAGYYTFAMHGFNRQFWNRANAHLQLGYQDRFYTDDLDKDEIIGWGISDHSILQQAALKIAQSDRPTFAHIILLTNHHPYDHVADQLGLPSGDIVQDHLLSLHYVDESIRAFFQTLDSLELLDDCIIAIYGDHDSALRNELLAKVDLPYTPLIADTVPLVIFGLESPPEQISKATSLQDLPVIALDELGIPVPQTFIGNSLRSNEPVLTNTGTLLRIQNSAIKTEKAPFDVKTLSKLAILAPEQLEVAP